MITYLRWLIESFSNINQMIIEKKKRMLSKSRLRAKEKKKKKKKGDEWKDQLRALATNGDKGSIQPINKRIINSL